MLQWLQQCIACLCLAGRNDEGMGTLRWLAGVQALFATEGIRSRGTNLHAGKSSSAFADTGKAGPQPLLLPTGPNKQLMLNQGYPSKAYA